MRCYWNDSGNRENYIVLKTLLDKVEAMRNLNKVVNERFCKSFQKRGRKLWRQIAGPYERCTEEIEDFINDNGSDDIEDDKSAENDVRINPYFEKDNENLEEVIVQNLKEKMKRKAARGGQQSSCDDESSSNCSSSSVDDESSMDSISSCKSNSSEMIKEPDEWMKTKRNALKERYKMKGRKLQPGRMRLLSQQTTTDENDNDEEDSFPTDPITSSLSMFNARILETNEGKEDENLSELDQDSSDDCAREGSLRSNLVTPKRKLVLIESDDEE